MVRAWIAAFALLTVCLTPAAGQETPDPESGLQTNSSSNVSAPDATPSAPVQPPVEPIPATRPNGIPGGGDPPGWFWVRADYLGWWLTGAQLPPLITTGPSGTPRPQAGVL